MRQCRRASIILAVLILGGACSGEPRTERALPEVPVQSGEALQVEVDPAATDTATFGTPGATPQTGDTL